MKPNDGYTRRDFLKDSALLGTAAVLGSSGLACGPRSRGHAPTAKLPMDLAVVGGGSPAQNCMAAVEALGGFGRFVHPGDRVVVKPNPIGRSQPEQAINTHPDMIEAVVRSCLEHGAADVLVVSHDAMPSMIGNGTAAAVQQAGGTLKALDRVDEYREVVVPRGRILRTENIAIDVLEADVFINMPIAKHHAGAEVTFAMKNLMGVNWDRIRFHRTDLQQCIAELAGAVRHDLIIMDANHVLLTNGPAGPGEVRNVGEVIAGVDPVAVDAFTMRYFGREPGTIGHIRIAHELGIGEIDLGRLRIKEFTA
ncbi:DUF362 domain-containing protein [Candidatus Eisenbacteria bacterium]|uniref:DUF362 domain-containing protein n=1 Tax=Eiseniibacteriota bacterium TaxID=2212470 RepID=A0ABV6YIA7_UNCEI